MMQNPKITNTLHGRASRTLRYALCSSLLTSLCLLLTSFSPSFAQEQKVDVTFGRVVVESIGVNGEYVRSFADLYDSEGQKVGGGKSEREGETFFHVREGTYSAVVRAQNSLEITSIRVIAGKETRVRADWGKLTLSFNDPGKYATFYDSAGGQIIAQIIPKGGKLSCYVKPGTYRIQVHAEPRKEYRNIAVNAGKETIAGDLINHPPKITDIRSDPPLVNAGQSARIRVEAKDEDGDPLTYAYKPSAGRIQGSGSEVIYQAPQATGPLRISVSVSDPHGATDSFDYFISSGELTVRSFDAANEPFNAHVEIYNGLEAGVEANNLGPGGARTWRLREGRYKLQVFGDNMIEFPDVQVTTDQKQKVDVLFGRVVVESFGLKGERVPASVDLFDSHGEKVQGGKENPGEASFNVCGGIYRATVFAANHIEITDIRVVPGKETRVRADWGRLTLRVNEPGRVANIYDSAGKRVLGESIDKGGRLSCYLRPGGYSIEINTEPRKEFKNLTVLAGKETLAGDSVNHPPRIVEVWSDPPLVKPGESARIRVDAADDDGDTLTYTYTTNAGRIEGRGEKVIYKTPQEKGVYRITVSVSDPQSASDSFDYFISGGELTVRAFTSKGDPLNAFVNIYNSLGARVEADNLGPTGVKTWQVRQGAYRVQVLADNMIEVTDVQVATDQKRRVDASFGKVLLESRGVGGEWVQSAVELYDSEGQKVGESKTGKQGKTSFDVAEGTYRAVLSANNRIEITNIRVFPGRETAVRADWGKLTLSFNEPGKYAIFYDSGGRKIMGETLGKVGRLSCYVPPGNYRIEVLTEPKKEFRGLVVLGNQETLAGDFMNQPPRIKAISSDPPLVKAGETSRIRVEAADDDGDPLTYTYVPNTGWIEGSGEEVVYHAPNEKGPYSITIYVSDPHDPSIPYDYFISGGDLTVRVLTGNDQPFDALVHIYDKLGVRAGSGNAGATGTRTWRLREGSYRIQVFGSNMIEVPEVNVVTDLDAVAVVNFGKLTVECYGADRRPLNTYVQVSTDGAEKDAAGSTGEGGVIDFNLRPGLYDIFAHQANVISKPNVRVDSQQQYLVSLNPSGLNETGSVSTKPAIERIIVKPIRAAGPRAFEVSVMASNQGRGILSYTYECDGATVAGSGPSVTLKGAGNGAIILRVRVRSEAGETAGEVMIPAVKERR